MWTNTYIKCVLFLFFLFSLNSEEILIHSFGINISNQPEIVKKNLFLSSEKLNEYRIEPKTNFSFSDVVGESKITEGYSIARTLLNGEAVYELGGGLCIVSSVVYNLLLKSGFEIIERHKHSRPVHYIPLGLDATIYFGKKNLKMKNPFEQSFIIKVDITESYLLMKLYSNSKLPHEFLIETEEDELEVPFQTNKKNFQNPIFVSVYRKKFSSSSLVEKKFLYKDFISAIKLP